MRNSKTPGASAIALIRFAARLRRGQRLPALWLMTADAGEGDIVTAMRRLPPGSGVIFRHYEAADRAGLAARLRKLARALRLVFLVAGDRGLAIRVRADGVHIPEWMGPACAGLRRAMPGAIVTMAAHGRTGLIAAARYGADAALLSPVFATRSHPGGRTLGIVRMAGLAAGSPVKVIALGGIDGATVRRLAGMKIAGIAAISGLMG